MMIIMNIRIVDFDRTEWSGQNTRFSIQCTCGKKHKHEDELSKYFITRLSEKFPQCEDCGTNMIIDGRDKYFYHVLEKTRTSAEVEFYEIKEKRIRKITTVKYDLILNKLWIEQNDELIELK